MELIVLSWLGFTLGVGVAASLMGRSGFGWGALAFFVSPLIAGIALAIAGVKNRCPACGTRMHRSAVVCPACGRTPQEAWKLVPRLDGKLPS